MNIYIDGLSVEAKKGQTILSVASAAGIRIPTLCFLKDIAPGGSCGICEVEADGLLLRACTAKVKDGMEIRTDSVSLKKRQKERLEALAQKHRFDCEFCSRCSDCEFIRLLNEYGIYDYEYSRTSNRNEKMSVAGGIRLDSTQCVGCFRCVFTCPEKIISLRDGKAQVNGKTCSSCGMCVAACPTAAFSIDETEELRAVRRVVHNREILCAAIVSPDAGAVFGEMIFDPAGTDSSGKIAAALRRLGFDEVYGANNKKTTADISDALHKRSDNVVTISISTETDKAAVCADIGLTIYGLLNLFRRACVSRHTMVRVWRTLDPEEFDVIDVESSGCKEYGFGGAMPHRDCYTRNLTDLSALRTATLKRISER